MITEVISVESMVLGLNVFRRIIEILFILGAIKQNKNFIKKEEIKRMKALKSLENDEYSY